MFLTYRNFRPLLCLVLPLALAGLVQSSVYFFETLFSARAGKEMMEAGALVSWLMGTFDSVIFGILSAINVLVSHKFGAKNIKGIAEVLRDGFWLALLLSLPTMVLFWNFAPVFSLFGQSPSIVLLCESCLHALTLGIPADFLRIAILEFLVGIGNTRIIILFSLFTVSCNIFFSFVLIFGKFGFPMLGIAGVGYGIAISNWIEVLMLIAYLLLQKQYRMYFQYIFSLGKIADMLQILKMGLPMGAMYCVEVAFFFVLTLMMGSQGAVSLAANQIALQYLATLMAVIFATAQAVTVRMGHLLGAGKKEDAYQSAFAGLIISGGFMLFIGIIYYLFPTWLISVDFDVTNPENEQILYFAKQFLIIAAIFQILEALRITWFGALRALKDTRFTLIVSLIGFWGIALPLGHVLATSLDFGGTGYWWGMVAGAFIAVLLMAYRFKMQTKSDVRFSVSTPHHPAACPQDL